MYQAIFQGKAIAPPRTSREHSQRDCWIHSGFPGSFDQFLCGYTKRGYKVVAVTESTFLKVGSCFFKRHAGLSARVPFGWRLILSGAGRHPY